MRKAKILHGAKDLAGWEEKLNTFFERLDKKECEIKSISKLTLCKKDVILVTYDTKEKADEDTND